jgi:rhamnose utilization protein RhaD (predicted bifunctional aldolase and dehydrogenase)
MSLEQSDIDTYIRFARLIGCYKELVQGSGGNISVKSDNQICIKSSGRLLAETATNYGYSICDSSELVAALDAKSEDTAHTVHGGEPKSTPSMEVFFHLLAYKWVVHVHPTFLLYHLCQKSWDSLKAPAPYLHIPYYKPGIPLAEAIFKDYTNQNVIFLQNHGVIVAAESPEEICDILDMLYQDYHSHRVKSMRPLGLLSAWKFQTLLEAKTGKDFVLKPCHSIHQLNERLFMPITPDCSLFLKHFPLVQEYAAESVEHLLAKYMEQFSTTPNVCRLFGRVFVVGTSLKHAQCIEEILTSYQEICSYTNPSNLVFFEEQSVLDLVNSEKEKHRLQTL